MSALTPMLERGARARAAFVEQLREVSGISPADADRLMRFYLKHKMAKLDYGIGRISVKHGALLSRHMILRLLQAAS